MLGDAFCWFSLFGHWWWFVSGFINQFKEKYLFIVDFHMRCIVNYYFVGSQTFTARNHSQKIPILKGRKKRISNVNLSLVAKKKYWKIWKLLVYYIQKIHKMLQIMSALTIIFSSFCSLFLLYSAYWKHGLSLSKTFRCWQL